MATKFVNEEIQKYSNLLDSTRMNYSSKLSGNKFTLRFEKKLEGGWTDELPIQFVRLFLEDVGNISIDKVVVYKFGLPFTKNGDMYSNTVRLPLSINNSDNNFVDIPIMVQDEIFEIELTISSNKGRIYAILNGGDHNIDKSLLNKFREAEGLIIP